MREVRQSLSEPPTYTQRIQTTVSLLSTRLANHSALNAIMIGSVFFCLFLSTLGLFSAIEINCTFPVGTGKPQGF